MQRCARNANSVLIRSDQTHMSRLVTKPTKWHMHPAIRVFTVRMKKAWVLSYPLSALGAQSFCWFCHEVAHLLVIWVCTVCLDPILRTLCEALKDTTPVRPHSMVLKTSCISALISIPFNRLTLVRFTSRCVCLLR